MAVKISLINMKGGVGKTTLAVNLAWYFYFFKKVLIIDLDPQFNASQYLLGPERYRKIIENGDLTIRDVMMSQLLAPSDPIQNIQSWRNGTLDLVPSELGLATVLKDLSYPKTKQGNLSQWVADIEDDYDVIIIDCAPTESILTTAAYLSSDWLLVPVKPEYLSSIGLNSLVRSMTDFNDEHNRELKLAGVVFNHSSEYAPEENLSKKEVRYIAEKNGWHIFQNEIPFSRSYPKGAREGRPIFWTSYHRKKAQERMFSFAIELTLRILDFGGK